MTHPLDEALALTPVAADRLAGRTHPAYANMVGPFGGVTAAQLLAAVLVHPACNGQPIAQTVNFCGPIADGPFEIDAVPVRSNRSTQHWTLLLRQQGQVCASGSAMVGQRPQTWAAREALPPADMPPAVGLTRLAPPGALAWVGAYDMRFPVGEEPLRLDEAEQPHSASRLWIRDHPPRPLDFPALAGLCDAFFPRVFVRRRRRSPIGTVSLSTYFHADAARLAAQDDRYLLGHARALNFGQGYFDQRAEVWSDDGHLLASSHQMVYFRD